MIITTLKNQCIDNVIKDVLNTCAEKLNMQKKIPLDTVFRILQKHFSNKTNLENSKDPLFLLSKSINDKLDFVGDENNMEIRNRNWKQLEISNELHNQYFQCNMKTPEITSDLKANDLIREDISRNIE